jgi:Zn-dependent membrane protease YugP
MLLGLDPLYWVMVGPAILLCIWAQVAVKRAFSAMSKQPSARRLTGAEAAAAMLHREGLDHVRIEPSRGFLSDHYDPRARVLRLSPDVYSGRHLAAVGVAAHEAGHAIQHARGYAPLAVRNALVPMASFGSNFSFILIIAGMLLSFAGLIKVGIILFAATVVFQIVNLPVEFNASARARQALLTHGLILDSEDRGVAKVLNAAAMTYVAATLVAVIQLLYFVMRASSSD